MAAAVPPASESAGEQMPLQSDPFDSELDDGTPTTTLDHRDSVFSFVLFMPPLTRRTHGHYCTVPVTLAVLLFIMTITCQLALTLIAGGFIRERSSGFKVSLIRHQEWQAKAITPLDWLQEAVGESVGQARKNIANGWAPRETQECCNSAECIELYPCCGAGEKDRRPKPAWDTPMQSASSSFLAGHHTRRRPAEVNRTGRFDDLLDNYVLGSSGDVRLCRKGFDGLLDCSPPTYAYLDAWHELDDNGDGIWSAEEAEADRTNLGCRLGLSPLAFFNSAVRGIIKDARDTADNSYAIPLVPASVETRKAIPKAYFDHVKGLVVICTAADMGRCGQLIKQGTFDGAIGLKSGTTRGGIHDLDSALDFCQRMLRPNGVCDQTLPHTYQLYRSRTHEKCGDPSFEVGAKYTNPYEPRDAMSITEVSYSEYSQFDTAHQWDFQLFLALILLVWYVTLVLELSRIIQLIDMVANFDQAHHSTYSMLSPDIRHSISSFGSFSTNSQLLLTPRIPHKKKSQILHDELAEGADVSSETSSENETGTLVVSDLSRPHRIICGIMVAMRLFLWFYMANVGTTFLLSTYSYDDLLFNAVALAFIFELPEFLYAFLVQDDIKEQLRGAKTVPFPTSLPMHGWKKLLISRAFWGLFVIPLLVWMVCYFNYHNNIMETLEALQCACFQTGASCVAAQRFNGQWWDQYWKDMAPLANLRASYLS